MINWRLALPVAVTAVTAAPLGDLLARQPVRPRKLTRLAEVSMGAGAAAMNALGVTRAADGQLFALVETGEDHCGTCYADGVQMITGCTLGKGNISKLHYGKWGLTLIESATGRAVRVVPTTATMQASSRRWTSAVTPCFPDSPALSDPARGYPPRRTPGPHPVDHRGQRPAGP